MLDFGEVIIWYYGGWLVVDFDFEFGGILVDELDGFFGFDGGDGSVDVFGDNVFFV